MHEYVYRQSFLNHRLQFQSLQECFQYQSFVKHFSILKLLFSSFEEILSRFWIENLIGSTLMEFSYWHHRELWCNFDVKAFDEDLFFSLYFQFLNLSREALRNFKAVTLARRHSVTSYTEVIIALLIFWLSRSFAENLSPITTHSVIA